MNVWVEILGCVAGILTSSSFVPQFIKLKKQRIALGGSIQTYVFACVGSLIWLLYGTVAKRLDQGIRANITGAY